MLQVLKQANPALRKGILKSADTDLIKALCEIVLNTLHGHLKIKPTDKKKLQKYKHFLRNIADSKNSINKKREIFIQKGSGILPILLSTLLSSAVGRLINA